MLGHAVPVKIRILVDVLALVTGISIILSGITLYARFNDTDQLRAQQQHVNRQFRKQDDRQVELWHKVLCLAEAEVRVSPDLTQPQKVRAINFYDRALTEVGAKPCPIKRR